MTIEPDRRIFLIFWVSGEAYSSCFFEYRKKWMFRFHVHHPKCKLLLRRLQKAGVVFLSTNESAQVRSWRGADLGIEFDTATTTREVEREINRTIAFRFGKMIGEGCAVFDVEYKGEFVCTGSIDKKAEPPKLLLRKFQKMGVKIHATKTGKRLLEEHGYELGVEFDEEERTLF